MGKMADKSFDEKIYTPWLLPQGRTRYSIFELPETRFLPGSGSRPEAQDIPLDQAFPFGIDLFNHGCWWEAHEVWEDVWLGQLLQSLDRLGMELLIGAANLNLKIELGKVKASLRLQTKVGQQMEEWQGRGGRTLFGVNILSWYDEYTAYIDHVLGQSTPSHIQNHVPYLAICQEAKT